MKNVKETREAWLHQAIGLLDRDLFKPQKIVLPEKLRISVGIPLGRKGKGSHAIGQCWRDKASADGHIEIFICPELADPVEVLATVTHELVHAAGHWDHKAGFKAAATALGLTGKMTATVASEDLTKTLKAMIKTLPAYPHGALNVHGGSGDGPRKQGTRMLALTCPGCGYKVRTSAKWIEVGVPQCPCGLDLEPEGV
jgi:hypothetical protein